MSTEIPPLPPARSPWLWLGLLLPALILAGSALALTRPTAPTPGPQALAIDKQLQKAGPGGPAVVLIGNSMVASGVDARQLAEGLNLPRPQVAHATAPGSRVATWYAILQNRVLGGGHTPKVVVIGSTVEWLLNPALRSAKDRDNLLGQLGADEPVIDRLLYGAEPGPGRLLQRALNRRGPLRSAVVDGARDAALGALFPGEDAEAALAGVFAAEALRPSAGTRAAMPVLADGDAAGDPVTAAPSSGLRPPADGFVPELLRLARDGGFKLVFARMPVPPSRREDSPEALAAMRELVELINASGVATWVDLTTLPLTDADFEDWIHLGPSGRRQMTAALQAALVQLGAMGEGPLTPGVVPDDPPVFRRIDALPELGPLKLKPVDGAACAWTAVPADPRARAVGDQVLGKDGLVPRSPLILLEDGVPLPRPEKPGAMGAAACDGGAAHVGGAFRLSPRAPADGAADPLAGRVYTIGLDPSPSVSAGRQGTAWWVAPGSRLEVEVARPAAGAALRVLALPRGDGPALSVDLGAGPTPLRPLDAGAHGAELPVPPGEGPLVIALSADPSGAFWSLLDLRLRPPGGPERALLGGAAGAADALRVLDGPDRQRLVLDASPPPPVAFAAPRAHKGQAARADGPTALLGQLVALRKTVGKGAQGLLDLRLGGQPLDPGKGDCREVIDQGGGLYCHNDRFVLFSAPPGVDLLSAPLEASLRAERLRQTDLWIYPNDALTLRLPPPEKGRSPLPAAANTLELALHLPPPPEAGWPAEPLQVELLIDGAPLAAAPVAWAAAAAGAVALPLDRPVAPEARELALRVTSPASAPVAVLHSLTLRRDAAGLVGGAGAPAGADGEGDKAAPEAP